MRFTLRQGLRAGAQVGPRILEFGERFREALVRFDGTARLEADLLLALSHKLPQIVRADSSQPTDADFQMLHGRAMTTASDHPFVPLG
jgi:hypothetical protein